MEKQIKIYLVILILFLINGGITVYLLSQDSALFIIFKSITFFLGGYGLAQFIRIVRR